MFEIDDPLRRATVLARLGGVENSTYLRSPASVSAARPTRRARTPAPTARLVRAVRPLRIHPGADRPVPRREPASWSGSTTPITATWRPCPSRYAPRSPRISIRVGLGRLDAENLAAHQPAAIVAGLDPAPRALALDQLADDARARPARRSPRPAPGLGAQARRRQSPSHRDACHSIFSCTQPIAPCQSLTFRQCSTETMTSSRHVAPKEDPFDRVLLARPGPHEDLVGTQALEAGEFARGVGLGRGAARGGATPDQQAHHGRGSGNPHNAPGHCIPQGPLPRKIDRPGWRWTGQAARRNGGLPRRYRFAPPQVGQSGSLAIRMRWKRARSAS